MGRIYVDYENALAQAKKLEQAAAELEDAANIMNKALGECEGVWEGDSADAAFAKLRELITENNKAKGQALSAAAAIRSVVAKLKLEDKRLAALAAGTGGGGGSR